MYKKEFIAPVKTGDRMEVEIINEGREEHPKTRVAKVEGYIVFVQECEAKVGDKVSIEITNIFPKYGFAKVVESE